MSNSVTDIELTVTCKPFAAFGRGKYRVMVTLGTEPEVRVWDDLGHHYTLCHSLTEASQRSIVARARKAVPSDNTAGELVLCESADGWSLHAPGSTDEQIASGEAPYLVSGEGSPRDADYLEARRILAARS